LPIKQILKTLVATPLLITQLSNPTFADDNQHVYFGVGCFWHVQHEFIEAEKKILGRSKDDITVRLHQFPTDVFCKNSHLRA
jgi:hypothetical protein